MTKMLCHITDEHVPNDPQDAEDENPYVCPCGEVKRYEDELCEGCKQDRADSIRRAAEENAMADLLSTLEDIAGGPIR